ncbi:MAG: tetratricopeptide repeat protein [Candidatus Hodarchaeales archaeon]
MKDPKRILAEAESLMEGHRYHHAEKRLQEALELSMDEKTKQQAFLLQAKLAIVQGDPTIGVRISELKGLLDLDITIETKAEVLHVLGRAELAMGHYPEAEHFLQESLSLFRELQNSKAISSVLVSQGGAHAHQGHWDKTKELAAELFKLAGASGDSMGYGRALMAWAFYERNRGFHDLARDHYELASQLFEEVEDNLGLAVALNNLADIEIMRGDLSKGLYLLQRALFHEWLIGIPRNLTLALTQIGRIHMLTGNLQDAESFLRAAINLASPDQARNPIIYYYSLCNFADFERKRGKLDQALQLAQDAISLLERRDISGSDLGYAWGTVTSILLEMKDTSQAEEALTTGELICSSLEFSEGIVNNILLRGILELQKGNLGLAQEYLVVAQKKAEENELFEVQIQTELALADLYLRKLTLEFNSADQVNATDCLLRASHLAEQTALEPGKLEAKMLEAVAHSINLNFENAIEILRDVEARAQSLELRLIEEKAGKIKGPILSRMRVMGISAEPDEEMLNYIVKAQEYIADAQVALMKP